MISSDRIAIIVRKWEYIDTSMIGDYPWYDYIDAHSTDPTVQNLLSLDKLGYSLYKKICDDDMQMILNDDLKN